MSGKLEFCLTRICVKCVAVHLAVSAAQPIAAHGIVGKCALLAAVGSVPRAFLGLKKKKKVF